MCNKLFKFIDIFLHYENYGWILIFVNYIFCIDHEQRKKKPSEHEYRKRALKQKSKILKLPKISTFFNHSTINNSEILTDKPVNKINVSIKYPLIFTPDSNSIETLDHISVIKGPPLLNTRLEDSIYKLNKQITSSIDSSLTITPTEDFTCNFENFKLGKKLLLMKN